MMYNYGEEVKYTIKLLDFSDKKDIQSFSCGNEVIDNYIKNEIFGNSELNTEDGLHFKVCIEGTNNIIGFYSLASSAVIHKVDNYTHAIPAVKIDIFAIDKKFQKLHFYEDSKKSLIPDEHFYFSDQILCEVIKQCRNISENHILIKYIILYADKKALRFYKRNFFEDYNPFYESEQNQEVNNLIPMLTEL